MALMENCQVDLWLDGPTGIEHVAHLQQGKLGNGDASGVGEEQQHHATLGHAARDGGNANQVAELTRAKGGCAAGGGGHVGFSVRIGRES